MLECSFATDLDCLYANDQFGYYTCMTMRFKLDSDNGLIESVKGQHMSGKEQKNVVGLLVVRSNNKFLSSDFYKKFPNLKVLSVGFNSVENVTEGNFEGAQNLESIYINNNVISELGDNTFRGASKLIRIEMKTNGIASVSSKTFAGLTTLLQLTLDHNYLKSLPKGIFDDLVNLRNVSFFGNLLTSLDGDLFKNNLQLTSLIFSNNQLSVIGSNLVTHLKCLNSAHFYNNLCISTSLYEVGKNSTVLNQEIAKCTESNRPQQKVRNLVTERKKMIAKENLSKQKLNEELESCKKEVQKTEFAFKCFN